MMSNQSNTLSHTGRVRFPFANSGGFFALVDVDGFDRPIATRIRSNWRVGHEVTVDLNENGSIKKMWAKRIPMNEGSEMPGSPISGRNGLPHFEPLVEDF